MQQYEWIESYKKFLHCMLVSRTGMLTIVMSLHEAMERACLTWQVSIGALRAIRIHTVLTNSSCRSDCGRLRTADTIVWTCSYLDPYCSTARWAGCRNFVHWCNSPPMPTLNINWLLVTRNQCIRITLWECYSSVASSTDLRNLIHYNFRQVLVGV